MRIVQIIDNLYWGGAQKMLSMLVHELVSRQIDVVVVDLAADDAASYYAKKLREDGVDVISVAGARLLNLNRIARLIRFIRQGNFDLVQTHLSSANMLGVLAGRMAGLPVISTLHSTGVHRRYYNPNRYRLESMALRSKGCQVVAVGHAVAEMQQLRVGKGKNIVVIPNAMTAFPDLAPMERQKLRSSLIGDREGVILISVGRLSPDKGYTDMLTAFATTMQSHPSVFLVIAGSGPLADPLKAQALSLGIEDNVFFLGTRDDVPSLLKASDMYVSASYREGMSMSLLEAMAAGLPIIATNVGDAPRMFTQGSGILIQPGSPDLLAETVNLLLANPSRMRNMGDAAYERVVTQYGLEAWANLYINLYRDKIGKHND